MAQTCFECVEALFFSGSDYPVRLEQGRYWFEVLRSGEQTGEFSVTLVPVAG